MIYLLELTNLLEWCDKAKLLFSIFTWILKSTTIMIFSVQSTNSDKKLEILGRNSECRPAGGWYTTTNNNDFSVLQYSHIWSVLHFGPICYLKTYLLHLGWCWIVCSWVMRYQRSLVSPFFHNFYHFFPLSEDYRCIMEFFIWVAWQQN